MLQGYVLCYCCFKTQIDLCLHFLHIQILLYMCEGSKHRAWHTIEASSIFTSIIVKYVFCTCAEG